jgi:FecR-like protein
VRLSLRSSLPAFLLPTLLALPAGAADQAGVSAAVRGEVALTRLPIVGRQVVGGEPIFLQDGIKSGVRSGMQILLLDETVFTIGPESELVIDEFVYDPSTNAGKLSAEITKGVFRFVSGKIAHDKPEDMNLKLPSGTLGVRGTMVAGRVDPVAKSSRLVLLGEGPLNDTGAKAGAIEVCNAGSCVRVNRPGYGTIIEGPDAAPVRPFLFPRQEVDELTGAVSDPTAWGETAGAGGEETPPVGAGPGEGGEGDQRPVTDVAGVAPAGGTSNVDATRARLRTLEGITQASVDASQFTTQTVIIGGQEVQIPTGCTDVSSCLGTPVFNPGNLATADVTNYDQITALASSGLQTAVYQRAGLPLINTNGVADGSYDFLLQVSLGQQTANLAYSNINSQILGISGASFSTGTDYSGYATLPPGSNIPMAFVASGTIATRTGPCGAGCQAIGTAELSNGNGRIADSALEAMVITTPTPPSGVITGTVSANPFQPIPRPPGP